MRAKRASVLVGLCMFLVACGTADDGVERDGDVVRGTGTVEFFEIEGGFYAIRGDDGEAYEPLEELPEEFQQNGLPVRFEGEIRPDVATFRMVGPVLEVSRIRRR